MPLNPDGSYTETWVPPVVPPRPERRGYWEFAGNIDHPEVWLEDDPHGLYTWGWDSLPCAMCGEKGKRCLNTDNSSDEYTQTVICLDCVRKILDERL